MQFTKLQAELFPAVPGTIPVEQLPVTANGHFLHSAGILPGKAGNGAACSFVNCAVRPNSMIHRATDRTIPSFAWYNSCGTEKMSMGFQWELLVGTGSAERS